MFLKLTLIGMMAFIPFIAGIPLETPTRVGKFLGWLSVQKKAAPLKRFMNTKTRWQGELSLTFGGWPLIASVQLYHYIDNLDRPDQHETVAFDSNNVLEEFDSTSSKPSNDSITSNTDVQSGSTEAAPLNSTTETTQEAPSALKLEDYVEIVFDPDVEENRVRRETRGNKDVNNQISNDVSDGEMDSTTVESSTLAVPEEEDSTDGKYATLAPPTYQNIYYTPSSPQFPYAPSKNPTAQYVTFTHSPLHYNFYPSQPDYQGFVPFYCISSQSHLNQATWPDYHKWK